MDERPNDTPLSEFYLLLEQTMNLLSDLHGNVGREVDPCFKTVRHAFHNLSYCFEPHPIKQITATTENVSHS